MAEAKEHGRRYARPLATAAGVAVTILVALAVLHNSRSQRDYGQTLRDNATAMRGQVAGLALLRPEQRQSAVIFLEAITPTLPRPAPEYFAALDRFGERVGTEADVLRLPPAGLHRADQALFGFSVSAVPLRRPLPEAATPPQVLTANPPETKVTPTKGCITFTAPVGVAGSVELPGSPDGFVVKNTGAQPLNVEARRYAPDWQGPAGFQIAKGKSVAVRLKPDLGTAPWHVLTVGRTGQVCSLAPAP